MAQAMRLRLWPLNLLVYAGLVLSGELADGGRWLQATAALAAYCLASSAGYLLDAARRGGPGGGAAPRFRPYRAVNVAGILALIAISIVARLGLDALAYLAAFLVVAAVFALGARRLRLLAVALVAGLFGIRAAAGADAADVAVEPWVVIPAVVVGLVLALRRQRWDGSTALL